MVRGNVRNGKRTRRTRQQILLEAEAALLNRAPSSIPVNDSAAMSLLTTQPSSSLMASSSNGNDNASSGSGSNPKKSLRIMFQDAKSGKLGRRRRTKIRNNYVWPRTVEAAKSPFFDATGKNKMFFVLAINLYPESKIIQPSDSESDDEEENTVPVNDANNGDPDPDSFFGPTMCPPIERTLYTMDGSSLDVDEVVNAYEDTYMREKSLSPVSPKVKRGRRSNNARRIPYGRAADIDHSWRSNYNRRCIQRRKQTGTRQVRSRIVDPQVILDVINTVVESYSQGINRPNCTVLTNDDDNNANIGNESSVSMSDSNNNNFRFPELSKQVDQVVVPPPPTLAPVFLEEKLISIKREMASSESSDVEVDVVDEEKKIPGERTSYDDDDGRSFRQRLNAIFNFSDGDDDDEEEYEVVVH